MSRINSIPLIRAHTEMDNRYDPDVAIRNAVEFVAKQVDLVLEFQVEEAAAPRVAHIFKKAEIPMVAIDVPHPNATYFGVDNFEVGYEAAAILAQYAQRQWKGKVENGRGLRPRADGQQTDKKSNLLHSILILAFAQPCGAETHMPISAH